MSYGHNPYVIYEPLPYDSMDNGVESVGVGRNNALSYHNQSPTLSQTQLQPSSNSYSPYMYGFKRINISGIIQSLGKPDLIDPYKGGVIIWKKNTLKQRNIGLLKRVEITDDPVIINNPIPHVGSVTCWMNLSLNKDQERSISNCLGPVCMYDSARKWVQIRSHNLGVNIVIYGLLVKYKSSKISLPSQTKLSDYFGFGQQYSPVKLISAMKKLI